MTRIDPFTDFLPTIDLHGEYSSTVFTIIDNFITDNVKMKKKKIVFIHGKGLYVIQNKLHEILKNDNRVEKYYLDMNNLGKTIVELR